MIDVKDIFDCLPQRYPILMIDRVTSCEPGKQLTAIKNVSINEPYFVGHFPEEPIMPGVLIIESMAQACGVLALLSSGKTKRSENELYFFAGIDNARFKQPVKPGDQLILTIVFAKKKSSVWKFSCKAEVGENEVCNAEITIANRDMRS